MSKSTITLIVLIVAVASIMVIRLTTSPINIISENPQEKTVDYEQYNFQNWKEFTAVNLFKVLMPTLPQHASKSIEDSDKQINKKYDMYVSERGDRTIFMITLISFLNKPTNFNSEQVLKEMMNNMIGSNSDNTLQTVNLAQYNGYPSLDFSYSNKETYVDTKAFMVNGTMFVLTRASVIQNYNTEEFRFFINSFELSNSKE